MDGSATSGRSRLSRAASSAAIHIAALRAAEIDVPCRDVALPQEFQDHASRCEVLTAVGLTDQHIARQITGWVAALGNGGSSIESAAEISERLD